MKLPRLDNWTIINYGTWAGAEGYVYDSDKFDDGDYIHTSYLLRYSLAEGKITTRNTTYLLGKPKSEFTPPREKDVPVREASV